jgi:hypothetical protein
MDDVLDSVADAADQVATDQRQLASEARSMLDQRRRGLSWASIFDRQPGPGPLGRIRRSRRTLSEAGARLGREVAEGMAAEGESHRAIARRLGVSHQRVTTILNGDGGDLTVTG